MGKIIVFRQRAEVRIAEPAVRLDIAPESIMAADIDPMTDEQLEVAAQGMQPMAEELLHRDIPADQASTSIALLQKCRSSRRTDAHQRANARTRGSHPRRDLIQPAVPCRRPVVQISVA